MSNSFFTAIACLVLVGYFTARGLQHTFLLIPMCRDSLLIVSFVVVRVTQFTSKHFCLIPVLAVSVKHIANLGTETLPLFWYT